MSTQLSTIKTAAVYREMAADCGRREQESWERSDTDGFLSQWALTQLQAQYTNNAHVVEAGGIWTCVIVELATNKIIATGDDQREGNYGYYYLITDDAVADRVGRFLTDSSAQNEKTRERNNAKKGIRVAMVFVPLADCRETNRGIEAADYAALKGTVAS